MIYRELTKLRKEITRLSQENKALKTALTESDSQQLSQSLGELAKLKEIYHNLIDDNQKLRRDYQQLITEQQHLNKSYLAQLRRL